MDTDGAPAAAAPEAAAEAAADSTDAPTASEAAAVAADSEPAAGEAAAEPAAATEAAAEPAEAAAAAAARDESIEEDNEGEGRQGAVAALHALEQCSTDTEGAPWSPDDIIKLFVFCLLSLGSKTQTHLHRALSNYAQAFTFYAAQSEQTPEEQQQQQQQQLVQQVDIHPAVLQAIQKYWTTSQQR